MAGASMKAHLDDRALEMRLTRIMANARDMKPAMQSIGEHMLQVVDERFTDEKDPDGNSWQPHGAVTLMSAYGRGGRKTHKKRGGLTKGFMRYAMKRKIMTDSHRLRDSITYKADQTGVVVGTNVIYAAIHQFGGEAGRRREVTIPARPYLGINETDKREAIEIIKEYLRSE